ncbi:unnamed protein product, partial [marine sediment metagenome]
ANGANEIVAKERRTFDSHREYIEELEARLEEAERLRDDDLMEDIRRKLGGARQVAFEEMSLLRHEVGLAKVPAVCEHLETALEGGSVILFAWHRDVVDAICVHFGDRAVRLTGDTPMDERQKAVDRFQAGEVDLFVGNIKAAGVGITLTASSHVVFAELDWVPGNLTQAEDRPHRIGQKESVLVQHLVFEDSVDAYMVQKLIAKQAVIHEAMDEKPVEPEAPADCKAEIPVKEDVEQTTIKVKVVEPLPKEQAEAIHKCLQRLAGTCDGAFALDNRG